MTEESVPWCFQSEFYYYDDFYRKVFFYCGVISHCNSTLPSECKFLTILCTIKILWPAVKSVPLKLFTNATKSSKVEKGIFQWEE